MSEHADGDERGRRPRRRGIHATSGGQRRGACAGPPTGARPVATAAGRDVRVLVGRGLMWAAIAVVLLRGAQAILAGPDGPREPARDAARAAWPDAEARALAIRFTHAYLGVRAGRDGARARERELRVVMAQGLSDPAAVRPPHRPGVTVAQATVAREAVLGGARAVITVAAQLSDGSTHQLAVPLVRDGRGRPAVEDLPALVAPPPTSGAPAREWVALSGAHASAIDGLVRRFVTAYLSGRPAAELRYLIAPGARIAPLPAGVRVISIEPTTRAADGGVVADRPVEEVSALARARLGAGGPVLALRYRLRLARRDGRWQVAGLAGGAA